MNDRDKAPWKSFTTAIGNEVNFIKRVITCRQGIGMHDYFFQSNPVSCHDRCTREVASLRVHYSVKNSCFLATDSSKSSGNGQSKGGRIYHKYLYTMKLIYYYPTNKNSESLASRAGIPQASWIAFRRSSSIPKRTW